MSVSSDLDRHGSQHDGVASLKCLVIARSCCMSCCMDVIGSVAWRRAGWGAVRWGSVEQNLGVACFWIVARTITQILRDACRPGCSHFFYSLKWSSVECTGHTMRHPCVHVCERGRGRGAAISRGSATCPACSTTHNHSMRKLAPPDHTHHITRFLPSILLSSQPAVRPAGHAANICVTVYNYFEQVGRSVGRVGWVAARPARTVIYGAALFRPCSW